MLRASTQISGEEVDLKGIVDGNTVDTGVPAGAELIEFAEVSLGNDSRSIELAREAVKKKLGEAAMVDAAGVIANFQRMVRIADGTGIPLDTPMAMITYDMRENLGLNEYGSADNTPPLSFIKRLFSRLLQPLLPFFIRRMTRNMTKNSLTRQPG